MIDRDSILINRENVWNTYTLLNINLYLRTALSNYLCDV